MHVDNQPRQPQAEQRYLIQHNGRGLAYIALSLDGVVTHAEWGKGYRGTIQFHTRGCAERCAAQIEAAMGAEVAINAIPAQSMPVRGDRYIVASGALMLGNAPWRRGLRSGLVLTRACWVAGTPIERTDVAAIALSESHVAVAVTQVMHEEGLKIPTSSGPSWPDGAPRIMRLPK